MLPYLIDISKHGTIFSSLKLDKIIYSNILICEVNFMELRVLQYFLAVTREQSISGAAEAPHLSQPTLSLIKRNGRGIGYAIDDSAAIVELP